MKKRIGILSMQEVANYGSFLQAFALKTIFEQQDCDCEFISVRREFEIPALKRSTGFILQKINDRLLHWDFTARLYYELAFRNRFRSFHAELFGKSYCHERYDLVVIGSDEVFNCTQSAPWCFTSQLFGNIPNAGRIISYAASFGHTTYEDLEKYGLEAPVKEALQHLSAISVRDRNSDELIERLTGHTPQLHVDPVLIFDYTPYMPAEVDCRDYILVYSYPNRIKNPAEIAAIRRFAKEKGKKLVSIGFYFPWCDQTVIPHPFEVLTYFKQADYVITDTFHGSVLSIKFNKQFGTIIRNSNSQKLSFLLAQFGLQSREIRNMGTNLTEILDNPIDYTQANNILNVEQHKSIAYLTL